MSHTSTAPSSSDTDPRSSLASEGIYLARGLFDIATITAIIERLSWIAAHRDSYEAFPHTGFTPARDGQSTDPINSIERFNKVALHDPVLWTLVMCHKGLLTIAEQVLGPRIYVSSGGAVFVKPPHTGRKVGWHQDSNAWGIACGPNDQDPLLFHYWIALEPATRANGCMQLIPGSHRLGRVPHSVSDPDNILRRNLDPKVYGYTQEDIQYFPMQAGDVLFWHQDVFHASDANTSSHRRLSLAGTHVAEADLPRMQELYPRNIYLQQEPLYIDGHISDSPSRPVTIL